MNRTPEWFIPKYIALDIETGGIADNVSLLTAYFIILNKDLGELATLSLTLKPNNNAPYVVEAEGMGINKINLVEHDKVAVSMSEGGRLYREFIKDWSEDGKIKLIPLGQNVPSDVRKLYMELLNKKESDKYLSYRVLDTAVIHQFLQQLGLMPDVEVVSGSLSSLVEYFQIQVPGNPHEAEYDTRCAVEVYKKQLAIIQALKGK